MFFIDELFLFILSSLFSDNSIEISYPLICSINYLIDLCKFYANFLFFSKSEINSLNISLISFKLIYCEY